MVHSTTPNKKKIYRHPLTIAIAIVSTTVSAPIIHAAPALEEIVVTAQKVEESLQDTPVAVTAFTASALQNKGIENIAFSLGFSSPAHFSRVFKKHFGVSPSDFNPR